MMLSTGEKLRQEVDRVVAALQPSPFRKHLGWSVLGDKCARKVWYKFRWAKAVQHTGRLLRLFQRGHDEEARIVKWLRDAGAVVYDRDPETGKQFRRERFGGHFGGSGDGKVGNLERFDLEGFGLLEMKTHNDKSFNLLASKGMFSTKPEHWIQMQGYMFDLGLSWGLYSAINKNDDTLYFEIIRARPEIAEQYLDRAQAIIEARSAPPRASEDPTWFICKFCDYREICHKGHGPDKNCRSCVNARADIEGGGWYCEKWHAQLPDNFIEKGCDDWEPIE